MFLSQSPFDRLKSLLAGIAPGADPINFTVGSPRHAPPAFIGEVMARHVSAFRDYPPIAGTENFQRAVQAFCARRFGIGENWHKDGAILPLNGSREGLFLSAITARDFLQKTDPVVLFANPFYQAYPSAAHAIGATSAPLATGGRVLPDFDKVPRDLLDRAIAYYFCSPSNPQGQSADTAQWHRLFDVAERHDFFIFADECYSEVYRENAGPPVGALTAALSRPGALERLFVFNSLSKRSNLAGMRVGFMAGGAAPIAAVRAFRNQVGPQVPVPLLEAAAAVYDDEDHVIENRRLYDEKFADAQAILGSLFDDVIPAAGFFLWLDVGGDDVDFVRELWRTCGVRAVPGSFLTADGGLGGDPGRGRVRLALVSDRATTKEALTRLRVKEQMVCCRRAVLRSVVGCLVLDTSLQSLEALFFHNGDQF
ncbi:MAG: aminotransferase class I/II-fold pyridoxal phosphate-dependent enzyme [Pseudomonadota bacterium]